MLRSVSTRCAWIEDTAFAMMRPCNKFLAQSRTGYCPKHERVLATLIARRMVMERKPSEAAARIANPMGRETG